MRCALFPSGEKRELPVSAPRKTGFVFGDIHFPFHHKLYLAVAMYICIQFKPKYIVQIGDLHDKYSAAKFPRSYNLFTPSQEKQWCRYYAELFWGTLHEHLPQAEKYQLLGNHDVRPIRRTMEKAPEYEEEMVEALHKEYTFDNVKTIYDSREELDIDDVRFIHGWASKPGGHLELNRMNVVHGHLHKVTKACIPLGDKTITDVDVGYLADPKSKGLSYTAQKKASKWSHGFGIIDAYGIRPVVIDQELADKFRETDFVKELLKSL